MRFKSIFLIFALAMFMLAGAMGMATSKAEAKDVIITPTSIDRLGGDDTTWTIEDNNDVAVSADGRYLAMLVTLTRLPLSGEKCKLLNPPPYPNAPCLVEERALLVYDTTTEPNTLIGYKAGSFKPIAVEFVEHDGENLVAVLEELSQLVFYDLSCQPKYQTQLPEYFDNPYLLYKYTDFDVAYCGAAADPVIIVAGGAYYEEPQGVYHDSGVVVAVQFDPNAPNPLSDLLGNFVPFQSKILGCNDIVTDIDSEGYDGTITSAVICEEDVDPNTVKDTILSIEGACSDPFAVVTPQFISYRDKAYCGYTEHDDYSAVDHSGGITFYMSTVPNTLGLCRPLAVAMEEGQEPVKTVPYEKDMPGVDIIATDLVANIKITEKPGKTFLDWLFSGTKYDADGLADGLVAGFYKGKLMNKSVSKVAGALIKKLAVKNGNIIAVANAPCEATVTAETVSSEPVGGPTGGMDAVIIEFTITESDDDDEGEDD
jgi:hypothetical protein